MFKTGDTFHEISEVEKIVKARYKTAKVIADFEYREIIVRIRGKVKMSFCIKDISFIQGNWDTFEIGTIFFDGEIVNQII